MGMVCRHGVPLFFANITSAGERQEYAIALIEHLYTFLPPNTTVAALYDVGCTLDHTLNLVGDLYFSFIQFYSSDLCLASYSQSRSAREALLCNN